MRKNVGYQFNFGFPRYKKMINKNKFNKGDLKTMYKMPLNFNELKNVLFSKFCTIPYQMLYDIFVNNIYDYQSVVNNVRLKNTKNRLV